MACMKDTAGKSVKVGLSFFPPVVIEVGIVMLAEFQSHFRKYKPRYFTNIYTNYSLFYMLLMLTVDFYLYISWILFTKCITTYIWNKETFLLYFHSGILE